MLRVFIRRRCFVLSGAHVVVYSRNAEADRAFFRDVLGFRSVDAGHGWLIFAVPAAEVAFHPHDQNDKHEMFFTCDDLKVQMAALQKKGVQVGKISEERWGARTTISLPGGGAIGLYEPKHPVTFERNFSKKKRTEIGQRSDRAR
jgi:catechol 2,3-dioxygenase-like lactoylglutathione lyase family enzyme